MGENITYTNYIVNIGSITLYDSSTLISTLRSWLHSHTLHSHHLLYWSDHEPISIHKNKKYKHDNFFKLLDKTVVQFTEKRSIGEWRYNRASQFKESSFGSFQFIFFSSSRTTSWRYFPAYVFQTADVSSSPPSLSPPAPDFHVRLM